MTFMIESPAFMNQELIPSAYTCEAKDDSPPLVWQNPPPNTKSFVLIMDDPDAPNGTWVHWVLFNIPAETRKLDKNGPIPAAAISGINSWGKTGYGGPCPPSGTHRYFFKLYALDTLLTLNNQATKQDVLKAMQPHVIGDCELMGRYAKGNAK